MKTAQKAEKPSVDACIGQDRVPTEQAWSRNRPRDDCGASHCQDGAVKGVHSDWRKDVRGEVRIGLKALLTTLKDTLGSVRRH